MKIFRLSNISISWFNHFRYVIKQSKMFVWFSDFWPTKNGREKVCQFKKKQMDTQLHVSCKNIIRFWLTKHFQDDVQNIFLWDKISIPTCYKKWFENNVLLLLRETHIKSFILCYYSYYEAKPKDDTPFVRAENYVLKYKSENEHIETGNTKKLDISEFHSDVHQWG